MFVLTIQKFQSHRASLLAAGVLLALMVSGCTHAEKPSLAEASVVRDSTTATRIDYCPNLPGVNREDDLPDGIMLDYDLEKGFVCVPAADVRKRLEAMEQQHQEMLAQATVEVLGPQPLLEATAFDKTLSAIAYYCNRIGDKQAETAARLVYEANHVPTPPSGGVVTADTSFDQVAEIACGISQSDAIEVPPVEPPSDPSVNS